MILSAWIFIIIKSARDIQAWNEVFQLHSKSPQKQIIAVRKLTRKNCTWGPRVLVGRVLCWALLHAPMRACAVLHHERGSICCATCSLVLFHRIGCSRNPAGDVPDTVDRPVIEWYLSEPRSGRRIAMFIPRHLHVYSVVVISPRRTLTGIPNAQVSP